MLQLIKNRFSSKEYHSFPKPHRGIMGKKMVNLKAATKRAVSTHMSKKQAKILKKWLYLTRSHFSKNKLKLKDNRHNKKNPPFSIAKERFVHGSLWVSIALTWIHQRSPVQTSNLTFIKAWSKLQQVSQIWIENLRVWRTLQDDWYVLSIFFMASFWSNN